MATKIQKPEHKQKNRHLKLSDILSRTNTNEPLIKKCAWVWTCDDKLEYHHLCDGQMLRSLTTLDANNKAWYASFTWDGKHGCTELYLVCRNVINNNIQKPESLSAKYNAPLLKSNLQKAMRKKNVEVALATIHQLWHQDHESRLELLRRLLIIAVEDCEPMVAATDLPKIVWLMCAASKGFHIQTCHFEYVARAVYNLVSSDNCYRYNAVKLNDVVLDSVEKHRKCIQEATNDQYRQMLIALSVRIAFGGTLGDRKLLHSYWNYMLTATDTTLLCDQPVQYTTTIEVPHFQPKHMLLEAVDFHCTAILTRLRDRMPQLPPESEMRGIMWTYRSSPNVRHNKQLLVDEPAAAPPTWWTDEQFQNLLRDQSVDIWNKATTLIE